MDSIFDEDVDEVGGEIEAYCPSPRCKADTTHTIISMYEDEVRRVQCVVCGDVHAYRKPRGDVVEEAPAEAPKKRMPAKPTWEDALSRSSDADFANCRPYSIRDTYEEGDILSHPVFDIGIVTELLPDNKVEVMFKEPPPRILVHNRGDLAQRMPGISETPPPREVKKKKRAKKKDDASVAIIRRGPKELGDAIEIARQAAAARIDGGKPATPAKGKGAAPAGKKPEPVAAGKGAAKAPAGKAASPVGKAAPAAKKAEPVKAAKGAAKAAPAKKPAPVAKKAAKPVAKKAAPKKAAPKKAAPAKKPAPKKVAPKKAAPKKPAAKKPAPKKGKKK